MVSRTPLLYDLPPNTPRAQPDTVTEVDHKTESCNTGYGRLRNILPRCELLATHIYMYPIDANMSNVMLRNNATDE